LARIAEARVSPIEREDRKIALWRFLEQGLVPQGAMLANR
jgi:hypothetical protein